MRDLCAWAVPGILCLALYLVSLGLRMHARNYCFFGWLLLGVLVQLGFASARAGNWPRWTAELCDLDDIFGMALAAGSVLEAAYRMGWFATRVGTPALQLATRAPALQAADPVNSTIFWWMLLLVALDVVCLVTTRTNLGYRLLAWVHPAEFVPGFFHRTEAWLANAAFYVPAVAMLIAFSGTHIDRLLAWVREAGEFRTAVAQGSLAALRLFS